MRAGGLSVIGISLLMVSAFVGVAAAMEPNGSVEGPQPAQSEPDASMFAAEIKFPAFVSEDQTLLLHDAWQAHVSAAATAETSPQLMHGDAMSAARAAMKRIEDATRKAPAVRQAAEELSLRFSGLGGPTAADEAPASVVVPTAIGEKTEDMQGNPQDAAEAAAVAASGSGESTGAAPEMATSAIPEAEMRPQSAQLDELPPSLQSETIRAVTKIPPLPHRAPEDKVRNAQAAAEPPRMATVERPRTARKTVDRGEVFPHYMRAFGWDDQP